MIQWQGDLLTTSINSPAIRRKAIAFKPRESKSCHIPRNFRECIRLYALWNSTDLSLTRRGWAICLPLPSTPGDSPKSSRFQAERIQELSHPTELSGMHTFVSTVEFDRSQSYQARREFERYLSHAGMTCCAPFRGGSCFFRNTLGLGDLLTTSINTRRFAEKQSLSSTSHVGNLSGLGDLLTTSINTRRFAEKQSLSSRENPRVVTSHGTLGNWSRLPTVWIQRELNLTRRGRNWSCHYRVTV
ncbi:hypothetical protein T12_14387 [Trichinella patagoniensis]|uniref:Uncharacterized protein n=1 Tax=Trichinella patagoniensis TaxID=990121 RepID=A0A0V1A5K4_9BILA|nr:hypothetical protein T12_14387 [Trichinella patagoniensis]